MHTDSAPLLPRGLRAGGVAAGIKPGRLDLALLLADAPRPASALFTTNRLQGAHVPVAREHLATSGARVRAVLVNAGNANCSTGAAGLEHNRAVCAALAADLGCRPEQVLFLSTGVIGAPLPVEKVLAALPALVADASEDGLGRFSRAVMTTDTRPKVAASRRTAADGSALAVGVAKGAGMIHPDLATMLGFLCTDAALPPDAHGLLTRVADASFQRVTVDGDTSPNDTVVLLGGAERGGAALEPALTDVAVELARAIARDGEGATRLVTVRVESAPDERAATRVGRTIATSPLVKTAIAGRDPNWGRIVAAAGRAGVPFEPGAARLWIGEALVYERGVPHPEREGVAHAHLLDGSEVRLRLDLAAGSAASEVWTCDLTADYVRINADYRS